MSEGFAEFKAFAKSNKELPEEERFDALDATAIESLGGLTLTKSDLQYDGKQVAEAEKKAGTVARRLQVETGPQTATPDTHDLLRRQLFAKKQYDFLYENNRIKSIDVLCRQLCDVLTNAGMAEAEVHALLDSELSAVINQLKKYETVAVPKAEQAQEEMSLRARLISTAAARFFETTKLKPEDMQNNAVATDGDNETKASAPARTIEAESMSQETPKPIPTSPQEPASGEVRSEERIVAEPAQPERSVASLLAQADRLIELTKNRRLGERELMSGERVHPEDDSSVFSHKEAKAHSVDYAGARSDITKIKNRLRAILNEENVAEKRAEIDELRKSLANHLWQLRKDFPMQSNAESSPEPTVEIAPEALELPTDSVAETVDQAPAADKSETKPLPKPAFSVGDRVTVPRGFDTRNEGTIVGISRDGTIRVEWIENGMRAAKTLPAHLVEPLVSTSLPEEAETEAPSSAEAVTESTESVVSDTQDLVPTPEVTASTESEQLPSDSAGDYVLPTYIDSVEPDYVHVAKELGADTEYGMSLETSIASVRARLDEKIASAGTYQNSILAGTETDGLMTLKQKLQTLEERLTAAKNSPEVMRPEEVQALRTQIAEITYELDQMEATAPVTLLGLQVPRAGDSPFGARAFRDALLLEWQPFKRAAEGSTDSTVQKQKDAFERMFKILGYIPESGLTEAEAAELKTLAASIALPQRISGTYEVKPAATENNPAEAARLPLLVLTDAMRIKEEANSTVLAEALPAVVEQSSNEKRDKKARQRFGQLGVLATMALLAGILAKDQRSEDVSRGVSPDTLETSAPLPPTDTVEPTITIKPEVKPIEGAWPSAESDAVADEGVDTDTESPSAADTAEVGEETVTPTITDITDRVAKEGEKLPDYTVKRSDNLWDFAEGDVEGREPLPPLQGLSDMQKNLVLSDMVTALKYNPKLMRDMGLNSGNPNLIRPGEVLKTSVLVDLLNEIKRDRGLA